MVYIPEEILDYIIHCAAERDVGRNFNSASLISHTSLTSHAFHQILLPYKFRSLTFQMRHDRQTTVIPISKFCEAINAEDPHALSLAPLVQELSLLRWWWFSGGSHIPAFKKTVNSVLSLRNLTKLNIEKCFTTPVIMEQLGKLVQLQSLHTWGCEVEFTDEEAKGVSYGALSKLQSLHTLECNEDRYYFVGYLDNIPMENLRILKSGDLEVTHTMLTTDPSLLQLKELWLTLRYYKDYPLLWNFLARVTSLTHLSLPRLKLSDGPSSPNFAFRELQYLHIHVAFVPWFADQPLKMIKIDTESLSGQLMKEVRDYWQGIVFPYAEDLATDRRRKEIDRIPIEFWREFLPNVKKVG